MSWLVPSRHVSSNQLHLHSPYILLSTHLQMHAHLTDVTYHQTRAGISTVVPTPLVGCSGAVRYIQFNTVQTVVKQENILSTQSVWTVLDRANAISAQSRLHWLICLPVARTLGGVVASRVVESLLLLLLLSLLLFLVWMALIAIKSLLVVTLRKYEQKHQSHTWWSNANLPLSTHFK